uniref:Uncharacterized protein n=1 Tax=Setaria italica TaxID=4555 RepID=K3ZG20_SETIT
MDVMSGLPPACAVRWKVEGRLLDRARTTSRCDVIMTFP